MLLSELSLRLNTEKHAPTERKSYKMKKLTYEERKANLIERLNALNEVDDDE